MLFNFGKDISMNDSQCQFLQSHIFQLFEFFARSSTFFVFKPMAGEIGSRLSYYRRNDVIFNFLFSFATFILEASSIIN